MPQYIRVRAEAGSGLGTNLGQIYEIEVRSSAGGADISSTAFATSSNSNDPTLAFDDDSGTVWNWGAAAGGGGGGLIEWVGQNFGTVQPVDEIAISWYGDASIPLPPEAWIEYSSDGVLWTQADNWAPSANEETRTGLNLDVPINIAPDTGAFSFTGLSNTTFKLINIPMDIGRYDLSFYSANIPTLQPETANFILSGLDNTLNFVINPETVNLLLTGNSATTRKLLKLLVEAELALFEKSDLPITIVTAKKPVVIPKYTVYIGPDNRTVYVQKAGNSSTVLTGPENRTVYIIEGNT